jgi:hypothetical protein
MGERWALMDERNLHCLEYSIYDPTNRKAPQRHRSIGCKEWISRR